MVVNDPIAEMFSRIKNAILVKRKTLTVPFSRIKLEIIKILKKEGYLKKYEVKENKRFKEIQIDLVYKENGKCVLTKIDRVSKPGCRIYTRRRKIRPVLDGFGIAIISTSRGIMADAEARAKKLGGEVIANVW